MRLEHSLLQVHPKQPRTRAIIFASMVAVAQLVESRIVIPVVVGSSPISHPKYTKACNLRCRLFHLSCPECIKLSLTLATAEPEHRPSWV
jgi:hypothetical protein